MISKKEMKEIDACPWFTVNRMTNPCTCSEHTSKKDPDIILILIDKQCETHGVNADTLDSFPLLSDSG